MLLSASARPRSKTKVLSAVLISGFIVLQAGGKLAELQAEFEEFDAALLEALLEDQAGDLLEVRVYLGVSSTHLHTAV